MFPKIRYPNLVRHEPRSLLGSDVCLIKLFLNEFKEHCLENRWRNFGFESDRDILKYSDHARIYFSTKPNQRLNLIREWFEKYMNDD